uniref:TPM domain-containing protein n=1 Tax=Panagrolaimus davidi TaxID=227884 RepID=A0A914Q3S0_9BILA
MNIIEELKILHNNTSKGFNLWRIFQKRKRQGFIGCVAVANKFVGGNSETLKIHANELLKKWKMDEICQKSFLILIAVKDQSFWISKDSNIPIRSNFFTRLFNEQKEEFRSENYEKAIINIIHRISNTLQNETEKGGFGIEMVFVYCKYIFFAFIIGSCLYCCCHSVKFSVGENGYQSGGSTYYSNKNHYNDNRGGEESGGCDSGGGGDDGGGGGGGDW